MTITITSIFDEFQFQLQIAIPTKIDSNYTQLQHQLLSTLYKFFHA